MCCASMTAQELLAAEFATIVRHDFSTELRIPCPTHRALRSQHDQYARDQHCPAALAAAVASRFTSRGESFRVRTDMGCLVSLAEQHYGLRTSDNRISRRVAHPSRLAILLIPACCLS